MGARDSQAELLQAACLPQSAAAPFASCCARAPLPPFLRLRRTPRRPRSAFISSFPPPQTFHLQLNVAYANHEIVGDYTTGILKWFEGEAATDLNQLAAVSWRWAGPGPRCCCAGSAARPAVLVGGVAGINGTPRSSLPPLLPFLPMPALPGTAARPCKPRASLTAAALPARRLPAGVCDPQASAAVA